MNNKALVQTLCTLFDTATRLDNDSHNGITLFTDELNVAINGTPQRATITFSHPNIRGDITSYDMPFNDIKPFLDMYAKNYQLIGAPANIGLYFSDIFQEKVDFIKNYLKELKTVFPRDKHNPVLIPDGNVFHKFSYDNALDHNWQPQLSSCYSFTEFGVHLGISLDESEENTIFYLRIPQWEMHDYPCLQNNVATKQTAADVHELMRQLQQQVPTVEKKLRYTMLEHTLEHKNETGKKMKL